MFHEDLFNGVNFYPGLKTNANESVKNWACKLDAKAYTELKNRHF